MFDVRRITTISFDADGTLWNFRKTMRQGLQIALKALHTHVPLPAADELTVEQLIEIRDEVAAEMAPNGLSHEQIRLLSFERALEHIGRPDPELAQQITHIYLDHRFRHIETYPDVVPALDWLQQHFKLGIISNGNSYPDACGLAGYFEFETFSFRCGVAKPNPAIFDLALAEAGWVPNSMIHVGDSLENDVACPQQAGIHAIWLNRTGVTPVGPIKPKCEIRTLSELSNLLFL